MPSTIRPPARQRPTPAPRPPTPRRRQSSARRRAQRRCRTPAPPTGPGRCLFYFSCLFPLSFLSFRLRPKDDPLTFIDKNAYCPHIKSAIPLPGKNPGAATDSSPFRYFFMQEKVSGCNKKQPSRTKRDGARITIKNLPVRWSKPIPGGTPGQTPQQRAH